MDKPLYYVRNGNIHDNTYTQDSHPNDKRANYKAGESKGRMIGLEEAGWLPIYSLKELIEYIIN